MSFSADGVEKGGKRWIIRAVIDFTVTRNKKSDWRKKEKSDLALC